MPLGSRQLRQNPPAGGWLAPFATCIETDWVLVAVGSLESVAMKLTTNV
jgi:hypothetical protein